MGVSHWLFGSSRAAAVLQTCNKTRAACLWPRRKRNPYRSTRSSQHPRRQSYPPYSRHLPHPRRRLMPRRLCQRLCPSRRPRPFRRRFRRGRRFQRLLISRPMCQFQALQSFRQVCHFLCRQGFLQPRPQTRPSWRQQFPRVIQASLRRCQAHRSRQ